MWKGAHPCSSTLCLPQTGSLEPYKSTGSERFILKEILGGLSLEIYYHKSSYPMFDLLYALLDFAYLSHEN